MQGIVFDSFVDVHNYGFFLFFFPFLPIKKLTLMTRPLSAKYCKFLPQSATLEVWQRRTDWKHMIYGSFSVFQAISPELGQLEANGFQANCWVLLAQTSAFQKAITPASAILQCSIRGPDVCA
jgi:hypothetical protein